MDDTVTIVKTLTELATEFERMTDEQAMDHMVFVYKWTPPWFADGSYGDEFQAQVMDTVFALRKAIEKLTAGTFNGGEVS